MSFLHEKLWGVGVRFGGYADGGVGVERSLSRCLRRWRRRRRRMMLARRRGRRRVRMVPRLMEMVLEKIGRGWGTSLQEH